MAKTYYSTVFEQSAPEGLENRSRFQQPSGPVGWRRRERVRGTANPAMPSGLSGACFTRTGAFGSGCWRNDAGHRDELAGTLRNSFGKWLESLRSAMANLPAGFPEAATEEPGGRSQLVSG
jgi:hypothetical protein